MNNKDTKARREWKIEDAEAMVRTLNMEMGMEINTCMVLSDVNTR
ncbi:MAG: hypothetical protein JWQ71_3879 [Pedosphaera sp.]|nr:hypothetical protein [Pedosphaera sp.]